MNNRKATEQNRFDKALTDLEREVNAKRMSVGAALARAFMLGAEHAHSQHEQGEADL
jgi:hypothetical protein